MEGDPKKHKVSDQQQALAKLDLEIARTLEEMTKVDTEYRPDRLPRRICIYDKIAKSSDTDYYVNKK